MKVLSFTFYSINRKEVQSIPPIPTLSEPPNTAALGTGKNGTIGKRLYWKTAVLENSGIGKRRY